MIEYHVIRNKKSLKEFADRLNEKRLPLKIAVQEIEPVRDLPVNNYLWGIVYTTIAEATGNDIESVHEGYKRKFRFRHDFRYNKKLDRYEFILATQSTASEGRYELWNYIMQVRADAEIDCRIVIPMPNEVFVTDELSFEEDENT